MGGREFFSGKENPMIEWVKQRGEATTVRVIEKGEMNGRVKGGNEVRAVGVPGRAVGVNGQCLRVVGWCGK